MNYEELNYRSAATREVEVSAAFPALMRKVYLWMTLAMVITGFTAYLVATNMSLLSLIYSSKVVMWGLIIVELAIVFGVTAAINKLSLPVATLLFILYSVINGALLSSIFLIYTLSSISTVFFITAGTFGAMSLFGYTTKQDLTSWGKILMMAVVGLIIATIVNLFVKSSGLEMIVSYIGVLIFVGLTAYDTQKIKEMCLQAPDMGETMQKFALLGALSLYLDFINIFIYLLRIFGKQN